jgi:hypothetical protein
MKTRRKVGPTENLATRSGSDGRTTSQILLLVASCFFCAVAGDTQAALCDLSPLSLPEKSVPIDLGATKLTAQVYALITFTQSGSIYTIRETLGGRVDRAASQVDKYIRDQIGLLPNDQCGSVATIPRTDTRAEQGNLVIVANVAAEQWGCIIGVKALLANGQLSYTTTFHPSITDGRVKIDSTVLPSGDLRSTVPDFDPDVSATINKRLRDASQSMLTRVSNSVQQIHTRIDDGLKNLVDLSDTLAPLYVPKLVSINFAQSRDDISLARVRQAQSREGGACKLREVFSSKWGEWIQ